MATARVAPEKQTHHLPAVGFSCGAMKVNMNKENIGFDWVDADLSGYVIKNAPAEKLAVFPNQSGQVTLVHEDDGRQTFVCLTTKQATALIASLADAINEATDISRSTTVLFYVDKANGKA